MFCLRQLLSPQERSQRVTIMTRSNPRTKCPVSGKLRFRDAREAKRAIQNAASSRRKAGEDGVPCRRRERRCYECDECQGWHLTSWADALSPGEGLRPCPTGR